MTEHDKDQAFLQACKTMLDNSVHGLDDETKKVLSAIRRDAVASANKNPLASADWRAFMTYPAFAATAAAVAVVSLSLHLVLSPADTGLPQLDDMLLLTEVDDLAFYQDLDFYYWLEQQQGQIDG